VASYELVRTLHDLLQSNFATEGYHVLVCGWSNMLSIRPNFTVLDLKVRYQAGHFLKKASKSMPGHSETAVIIDFLGNEAFRQAHLERILVLSRRIG
jgi:hypothetical protein